MQALNTLSVTRLLPFVITGVVKRILAVLVATGFAFIYRINLLLCSEEEKKSWRRIAPRGAVVRPADARSLAGAWVPTNSTKFLYIYMQDHGP